MTAVHTETRQRIVDRYKVIDIDTHVIEPYDLWTSRIGQKWGEALVPHVEKDQRRGTDRWFFGEYRSWAAAGFAMAGWKEFPPDHPPTLAEADPASWDPRKRLERMDEYGIWSEVLFPNVAGFGSGTYLKLKDTQLMLDCVTSYNDWLADWCSVDRSRFLPIMALPFWDIDATVREIKRCYNKGFKGILFSSEPEEFEQPHLADPHWNPIWENAQELGLPLNFHVGSGEPDAAASTFKTGYRGNGLRANYAKNSAVNFLDNSNAIAEVITSGICHRFPRLNFISVESGAGWVPGFLETLDWQWRGCGVRLEHPEYELLPSEYFRRQIYGSFWFEEGSVKWALAAYPNNFLYETDFPHPTSMSPGPASVAESPADFLERTFHDLPEELTRKVLHENAARIYHLD